MSGTSVSEKKYAPNMHPATVIASGEKRSFAMPVRNVTGKNTAMITSVEASTGSDTSNAPSRAASNEGLPLRRCRSMFSSTTMVLSTNRPSTSAMPPRVMLLMLCPVAMSNNTPVSTESGSTVTAMNDDRTSPRKSNSTSTTNTKPPAPAHASPPIASRTYALWSKITLRRTSSGKRSCKLGNAAFTPSTAAMVLALLRLNTGRYTCSRPSTRAMFVCTALASMVVPMSRM